MDELSGVNPDDLVTLGYFTSRIVFCCDIVWTDEIVSLFYSILFVLGYLPLQYAVGCWLLYYK